MVLAASDHFASFALGIELLSVSLFALIAYRRRRPEALEAAVKYLILGGVSSSLLLFGLALVYSQAGTMQLHELGRVPMSVSGPAGVTLVAGVVAVLAGVGFKLALVPFHFWTPEVYEGAPTPVAAFIATVSKGAVFASLLRWLPFMGHAMPGPLSLALALLAGSSMVAGNVLALRQDRIRRLLAYSSIAHLGYMLTLVLVSPSVCGDVSSVYLTSYFLSMLAAFGCVSVVSSGCGGGELISSFRGLSTRSPVLSAVLTVAFLSLAGLPLTAGFVAKFYLVLAGLDAGRLALIVLIAFNSALSLYYYLRVVVVQFQEPSSGREVREQVDLRMRLALVLLTAGTLIAGVLPQLLFGLIR
jgi:NADH-quinone oxidoreductase subunit N